MTRNKFKAVVEFEGSAQSIETVYVEPLAVWEHALLEDDVDAAPLFWDTAYELGWPF